MAKSATPSKAAPVGTSPADATNAPPRRRKLWWIVAAAASTVGAAAMTWSLTREPAPDPALLLEQALVRLEAAESSADWDEARLAAEYLRGITYRDPEFPAGPEYILGMTAFHAAARLDVTSRETYYSRAARFLREVERQPLDARRRSEVVYALGVSLFDLGEIKESRPLLEEALEVYAPGRSEVALRLIEIGLDTRAPADLERALDLSSELLAAAADEAALEAAQLRQAEVLLALGRSELAAQVLDSIPPASNDRQARMLRAQTEMARGDFRKALELLEAIAGAPGLEQKYPRQASYLMGVCAERAGDTENAILHYERTAKRYEGTQEGIAGSLRGGELLRRQGRNEEALAAYARAVRQVEDIEEFRNRWISLEEFRRDLIEASDEWIAENEFESAIALGQLLSALLPATEALELTARAHLLRAEHAAQGLEALPPSERQEGEAQARRLWRASGQAWSELADAFENTPRHAEALWQCAEQLRAGRDFDGALKRLDDLIAAKPKVGLAAARLRRGEVLVHLDRQAEAEQAFRQIIAEAPSDPAAFEAGLLLGRCLIEQNRPAEAERALRDVLESGSLTPDAREWRLALFELGRLFHHLAGRAHDALASAAADPAGPAPPLDEVAAEWENAIRRLDEYVRRYPESAESHEARFLLARSLQLSAEIPRMRLTEAETENSRRELTRAAHERLRLAAAEYARVQEELGEREAGAALTALDQRRLCEAAFQLAHTLYALEDNEEAIHAYNSACVRYPQDPRVLLAYLQMSNLYQRLGKPDEARSMLEQAKVILRQPDAAALAGRESGLSLAEWEEWLTWATSAAP